MKRHCPSRVSIHIQHTTGGGPSTQHLPTTPVDLIVGTTHDRISSKMSNFSRVSNVTLCHGLVRICILIGRFTEVHAPSTRQDPTSRSNAYRRWNTLVGQNYSVGFWYNPTSFGQENCRETEVCLSLSTDFLLLSGTNRDHPKDERFNASDERATLSP